MFLVAAAYSSLELSWTQANPFTVWTCLQAQRLHPPAMKARPLCQPCTSVGRGGKLWRDVLRVLCCAVYA